MRTNSRLDSRPIPYHAPIDTLGPRHAAVGDHFVELGSTDPDIACRVVAG
jgi:hypothetical protein